jgi:hypothetical protein
VRRHAAGVMGVRLATFAWPNPRAQSRSSPLTTPTTTPGSPLLSICPSAMPRKTLGAEDLGVGGDVRRLGVKRTRNKAGDDQRAAEKRTRHEAPRSRPDRRYGSRTQLTGGADPAARGNGNSIQVPASRRSESTPDG